MWKMQDIANSKEQMMAVSSTNEEQRETEEGRVVERRRHLYIKRDLKAYQTKCGFCVDANSDNY